MGMKTKEATIDVSVSTLPVGQLHREAEALPTRIKVLNWGENPNANGKRVFLSELACEVLADPTNGYKRIALDFEHNTLPGTEAYQTSQEPREVAGFGDVEIIPGDGAYLTHITYTERGEAAAGNYIDVSAGVVTNDNGEVVMIHSVALCRNGAVPGMEFKQVPLSLSSSVFAGYFQPPKQEHVMNEEEMAALRKALNLPEDATAETIIRTAGECAAQKPVAQNADPEPPAGDKLGEVLEHLQTITKRLDALEKAAVVADAARSGKQVGLSADAIETLSLAQLKQHVEALPVTVPLSAVTPKVVTTPHAKVVSDLDRTVARACGLNPETDL